MLCFFVQGRAKTNMVAGKFNSSGSIVWFEKENSRKITITCFLPMWPIFTIKKKNNGKTFAILFIRFSWMSNETSIFIQGLETKWQSNDYQIDKVTTKFMGRLIFTIKSFCLPSVLLSHLNSFSGNPPLVWRLVLTNYLDI